jgi:hypothetical protein
MERLRNRIFRRRNREFYVDVCPICWDHNEVCRTLDQLDAYLLDDTDDQLLSPPINVLCQECGVMVYRIFEMIINARALKLPPMTKPQLLGLEFMDQLKDNHTAEDYKAWLLATYEHNAAQS